MMIPTLRPIALALLALAPLVGCYGAHTPGAGPGRDAGPTDRDGGPTGPDAGAAVGRDAGGPTRRDAGPIDCRSELLERYPGVDACSDAVSECLRACASGGGDECGSDCIGAEPECQRCFYQTWFACGNDAGCLDAWRALACCSAAEPACSGSSGIDRIQCAYACPAETDDYFRCINEGVSGMCVNEAAGICNVRLP